MWILIAWVTGNVGMLCGAFAIGAITAEARLPMGIAICAALGYIMPLTAILYLLVFGQ